MVEKDETIYVNIAAMNGVYFDENLREAQEYKLEFGSIPKN